MKSEWILLCHAVTREMKTGLFPTVEDGVDEALSLRRSDLAPLFKVDRVRCSPARVAHDTALMLGPAWSEDPEWSDLDYGSWSGRSIADIHDQDADGLGAWLSDPAFTAHGGESLEALQARLRRVLMQAPQAGSTLIVTHAIVLKVALATVLEAPLSSVYSMDFEPLSSITLARAGDAWRLRGRSCL
jgi:broad specificity phosphatase PhoE